MNNPLITKSFSFSAAHKYGHEDWSDEKNAEVFGLDAELHGHNYTLEVTVTGEINPETGFVADLNHLKEIVHARIIEVFDHSQIEKAVDWFKDKQPSSENLSIFIWNELKPRLNDCELYRVQLRETDTIVTDYYGPEKCC